MSFRQSLKSPRGLTLIAFGLAVAVSALIAGGAATIIEQRSQSMVRLGLEAQGFSWAKVEADGLQVLLSGTAPTEAKRFRALTLAGSIIENSRVVDLTDVEKPVAFQPPAFSLEILRNDDGISLIGLVPEGINREVLLNDIRAMAADGSVTDMLESADYPAPKGWQEAMDFGMTTLKTLPRSKISITPKRVVIAAITASAAEKFRVETEISRRKPGAIEVEADISAPRPVITPFTLRFLIDGEGARFEACSADTERARARILTAAKAAGVSGEVSCAVGMGTPTPRWGEGVALALKALGQIGAGSVTFADADIALIAPETVAQDVFDDAVGELESNLPEVFSLKAELLKKASAAPAGGPQFIASLSRDGQVQLRGKLTDTRLREAAETLARAKFGASAVFGATRLDETLPAGWALRSLAAIEALDELTEGSATVTPALISVSGVTGNANASNTVARLIARRLGKEAKMSLSIRYDKRLDPVLGLPTGAQCAERLNAVLGKTKISFEPGASVIAAEGGAVLDGLAKAMENCAEFRMEIAGHTDAQGSETFNATLSQERAEAVIKALSDRRIKVGNLSAKGYGESQPLAENETEAGRETNRRIEFVLLDAAAVAAEPAAAEPAQTEAAPTEAAPTEAAPSAPAPAETPAEPAVTLAPAGPTTVTPKPKPQPTQ